MLQKNKQWGSIDGVAFGVPGYSNAGFRWDPSRINEFQSYLSKNESKLARDVYLGFKYQCVEYARRFMVHYFKCAFDEIHHAYEIWNLNTVEDLTRVAGKFEFKQLPQGGHCIPEVGDLIIYKKSQKQPVGHVAVIVGVGANYVDIAEQNYEENGWEDKNYSRRVQMHAKNDCYEISNVHLNHSWKSQYWWDRNEIILGWKRVVK